jgi:hypothetical protein
MRHAPAGLLSYPRRVRRLLVTLALVAGCGSSQNSAADMAAPSGERDLSVTVDLSAPATDLGSVPPVDLAGWCVGTTLAGVDADGGATGLGECARQYFLQLADCFRPADGCSNDVHISGNEFCWDDGANAHLRGQQVGWFEEWWTRDRICMFDTPHDFHNPTGQLDFCMSSATGQCGLHSDGGGLQHASYDNGVFTCPDGTEVMIDLNGCPALNALLQPATICVGPSNCIPSHTPP